MSSRPGKVRLLPGLQLHTCATYTFLCGHRRLQLHSTARRTLYLCLQGITKRFSKGLDGANTARSNLRPTEKVLATQHSNHVQVKLDDDLQSLVRRLQPVNLHATLFCVYVGGSMCTIHADLLLPLVCTWGQRMRCMADSGGCQRPLTHSETQLHSADAMKFQYYILAVAMCSCTAGNWLEQVKRTRSRERSCESATCYSSAAGRACERRK